jgi:hypothetical protein
MRDLTNDGPLATTTVPHNLTIALPDDTRFAIGDNFTGDFDFEMDGLIDQVRFSDRVLMTAQLQVPLP